jgi:hypothetical protein
MFLATCQPRTCFWPHTTGRSSSPSNFAPSFSSNFLRWWKTCPGHKQTHTKKTQPCAAAPTSTGSFKRRSKLHVTTLRYARYPLDPTCIALAAEHLQLLLKFVDFLAFPWIIWIMTGAYPNPQRLLWWYSPLIQRYTKKLWNLRKVCLKSFEKYFQAFGVIQFSFHSKVFFSLRIEPLYVQRVGPSRGYRLEVLCKVLFSLRHGGDRQDGRQVAPTGLLTWQGGYCQGVCIRIDHVGLSHPMTNATFMG